MDSIANMFSQLKNASAVGKEQTLVKYSKMNLRILEILKKRGIICDFCEKSIKDQKYPVGITVDLKYKANKEPIFTDIQIISRSGRRFYIAAKDIFNYSRGQGELIISTSQGVMIGNEARRKGVGGEIIGKVKI